MKRLFTAIRLFSIFSALVQSGTSFAIAPTPPPRLPHMKAQVEFERSGPNLSIWGRRTLDQTFEFATSSKTSIESISVEVRVRVKSARRIGKLDRPSTETMQAGPQCQKTLQDLFAPYVLELQLKRFSISTTYFTGDGLDDYSECSATVDAFFSAPVSQCEIDKPCNIVCTSQGCRPE